LTYSQGELQGVSAETIQLVRRNMHEDVDYNMEDGGIEQGDAAVDESNLPDVWEDVDMPVDDNFRYAMRDASEMLG
jgi:hypothetical protein